jgi:hypothetical protein
MSHPSTAEQLRSLFDPSELETLARAKEALSLQEGDDLPKIPENDNGYQKAFLL